MTNRVALWNAINRYVISCRGDPAKYVYGNTTRAKAVVEVEKAIEELVGVEDEEERREKIEHDELVGLHGGHRSRKGAGVKP